MFKLTLLENGSQTHEATAPGNDPALPDFGVGEVVMTLEEELMPELRFDQKASGWEVVMSDDEEVATGTVRRLDPILGGRFRVVFDVEEVCKRD